MSKFEQRNYQFNSYRPRMTAYKEEKLNNPNIWDIRPIIENN